MLSTGSERAAKSQRTTIRSVTPAAVSTAAQTVCDAGSGFGASVTSSRRSALATKVQRGLELLLPGDALALERARRFHSIAEEAWERELQTTSWTYATAAAEHSEEGNGTSQHSDNPTQSLLAQSTGTQQTPVLQYESLPNDDAADTMELNVNNSISSNLGQSFDEALSASSQPVASATDGRHTPRDTTARLLHQELLPAMHALLGSSYWYCEHIAARIAAEADESTSAVSQLQEQRHMCQEVEIYAEFAWLTRALNNDFSCRAGPPKLLLLAAQQELRRLSVRLESHAQTGSTEDVSNPAAVDMLATLNDGESSVSTVPSKTGDLHSIDSPSAMTAATSGLCAVNSVKRVMLNDQCWRVVRLLVSVHGVGLRKALTIHERWRSASTSASVASLTDGVLANLLLEKNLGLTACQQLALNVRGQAVVPRLCPQSVKAEVLRQLQAQCDTIAVGDIVWRWNATQTVSDNLGPDPRFSYALVVVLSYSKVVKSGPHAQCASQAAGNGVMASNAKEISISRHHLRHQAEALLRRVEQRQGCFNRAPNSSSNEALAASTPAAAVAAAAGTADQRQFVIHGLAWDDDGDNDAESDISAAERQRQYDRFSNSRPARLCAHVTLGDSNPLVLDMRILPSEWSSLGRAWYSISPVHLSRRILARAPRGARAGYVTTALQDACTGLEGKCHTW